MKELKTYISEGFFNNVGANNIIKPAIDAIKDASMNDKIDSSSKSLKFIGLLTSILKDLETNIKKGKLVFEYTRNDSVYADRKTTITLEMTGSKDVIWTYAYDGKNVGYKNFANLIAFSIANDLHYEAVYPAADQRLRHSIAKTIKVTEFKVA